MPFFPMSSRQRKQSWKEQRKCTGSTILYYSMMDDWIVFENMQCFWTCVENVPSLCHLPQTSFILLLKSGFLVLFVCFVYIYFLQVLSLKSLISVQTHVFHLRLQSDIFCLPSFLFLWQSQLLFSSPACYISQNTDHYW